MPLTLDDVPVDPRLACAIGNIIIAWTRVEQAFESDMQWLLKAVPKRLVPSETEMPRMFDRRLKLWRRFVHACYTTVPHYISAADEIYTAADLLADWRNNLTHGWLSVEQDGTLKIVNTKREGRHLVAKVFEGVKLDELDTALRDIKRLEQEIRTFTLNHALMKTHLPKP
jgi:hypothetical protein